MAINQGVTNTANGNQLARRQMVLFSLTSLSAVVYRQKPVEKLLEDQKTPNVFEWDNVSVRDPEPTDYQYDFLGWVGVLWQDYNGGSTAFSGEFAVDGNLSSQAQIEPYNHELEEEQALIEDIPDWNVQLGDWVGVVLHPKVIVWYEIVGTANAVRVPNMAVQYILNYRDRVPVEPINQDFLNKGEY